MHITGQVPHHCHISLARYPTIVISHWPGTPPLSYLTGQVPHHCHISLARYPTTVISHWPGTPPLSYLTGQVPHHCHISLASISPLSYLTGQVPHHCAEIKHSCSRWDRRLCSSHRELHQMSFVYSSYHRVAFTSTESVILDHMKNALTDRVEILSYWNAMCIHWKASQMHCLYAAVWH